MNSLDIGYINRLAPYKVWTENGRDYLIETTHDMLFRVGFMDDYSIWPNGAYQFTINNESHRPSPNDPKLKNRPNMQKVGWEVCQCCLICKK